MSQPQLFQHMEPNASSIVTIVTFQKQDRDLVYLYQASLELEIGQVIAEDKKKLVFINDDDGIWFGGVNKAKTGRILVAQKWTSLASPTLSILLDS